MTSLSLMFLSAALGATTMVDFAGEAGLVDKTGLSGRGKAALQRELKKLGPETQVTVITCTDKGVGVRDATALADAILAEAKKLAPRLTVSKGVRDAAAGTCPHGFFIEHASLPTTNVPLASVVSATGKVEAQLPDGRTIPIYEGSVVIPNAVILTQKGARCTVRLPEGSTVRIGETSKFSLETFQRQGSTNRQVKLKLWFGKAWAKVQSVTGSAKWDLETGNAVAGVRGTAFQLTAEEGGGTPSSQVAVHEGAVALQAGKKSVAVPQGYGAAAKGTAVSDPRPLPAAPTGLSPEQGTFVKETVASWGAVPGAVAYRLEVASDVQFTDVKISQQFATTKVMLESPEGLWYWRVVAIDGEGYESAPSQLFKIRFDKKQ